MPTFDNGRARISYTVQKDGNAYAHSLEGEPFSMRGVLREMESHLLRNGFDRFFVAKDILTEAHEIERIMGRQGIQPRYVVFEKVLYSDGTSSSIDDSRDGRDRDDDRPGDGGGDSKRRVGHILGHPAVQRTEQVTKAQ